MALHRALITIPAVTQNPEDITTNSLYFDFDGPNIHLDITAAIAAMYESIDTRMSSRLATSGATVEYYRLSDPAPRRAVHTDPLPITNWGPDTLPTECAIVLSFQAEPISGLPQARRRGRIYLGPLSKSTVDTDGMVTDAAVAAFANAGRLLLDASDAAADWTWAVYSPTDGTGANVANGWVDDSFDTQRRRGRKATSRSLFN